MLPATMRRWIAAYQDSLKGVRADATVDSSGYALRKLANFLESHQIPLSRLTDAHLQAWVGAMVHAGLKPGSISLNTTHARAFVTWAQANKLPIPAQGVLKLPRVKKRVTDVLREKSLTAYMLASRVVEEPYSTAISILPLLGVRNFELITIKLADIRKQGRWAMFHISGKSKADRVVPLLPAGRPILGRYLSEIRPGLGDSEWLFPNKGGRHIGSRALQRQMRHIREQTGIEHITPHLMRHTYATLMAEAGISPLDLQKILGHENASTTAGYYHQSATRIAGELEQVPTDWATGLPVADDTSGDYNQGTDDEPEGETET